MLASGVEVLGVLASGVLVLGVLVSPPPQDTRAMHMARARTRAEIFFIYKSSFFSCSCVYFASPAPPEGDAGVRQLSRLERRYAPNMFTRTMLTGST